ncbi:BLOC-1-related complex subunit 7 isoform 2-T2 [Ciconia maguari]
MSGLRCAGGDRGGTRAPRGPAPGRSGPSAEVPPPARGPCAFSTLLAPGTLRSGSRRGEAGRGQGKMAAGGAADAQARFGHSVKGLLTEKVTSCGTDVIALTKQVLKGSRSSESLRKMAIITTHLQYQQEAIQKNVEQSSNLQDQLNHLLK